MQNELTPIVAATAAGLARSCLADDTPTFPPGTDIPEFRRALEIVLVDSRSVEQYVALLDKLLGRRTPFAQLPDEQEIDRFGDEGLGWVAFDRLALLAIDRGALRGMHQSVLELWTDFWFQRAIESEELRGTWEQTAAMIRRVRSHQEPVKLAASEPEAVDIGNELIAADVGTGNAALPVAPTAGDRILTVPASQATWLTGKPFPIKVAVSIPSESAAVPLTATLSPLSLSGDVICHAWLIAPTSATQRATLHRSTFEFRTGAIGVPCYLVFEYRSTIRNVFFAVSLDDAPLTPETRSELLAAAAADLSTEDAARANELTAG